MGTPNSRAAGIRASTRDSLPQLFVLLVKFSVVITVNMAIARAWDRVNGTLALLKARWGDFGGIFCFSFAGLAEICRLYSVEGRRVESCMTNLWAKEQVGIELRCTG